MPGPGTTRSLTPEKRDISRLNSLYINAESADSRIFSEMRSNILLYAGEHYTRQVSQFYNRIRETSDLSREQRIRLTKNHIQFICDHHVNTIISANPGVGFTPKNEKEVHDQKVAQLHHSVWRDACEKYGIDSLKDDWAESFVQIGEVHVKVAFDPTKGKLKGHAQLQDESGQPLFLDEEGGVSPDPVSPLGMPRQMAPDEDHPIHEGEFCFDEIEGPNLLRPPECKDLRKASWLGSRKMVDTEDLKRQFPGKEDMIHQGPDETYKVFDSNAGAYAEVKDQTLVIEYYFRPCMEYPRGYFYITTKEGILAEGELPGGEFPIVSSLYRKVKTTPRGRSPIKTLRPFQAEINRASSKMAEHQITLGDDKLIIWGGSKVSQGTSLPGVRSINVTGQKPDILAGRDGSQYLGTLTQNVTEMYQIAGMKEEMEEDPSQLDPYMALFRAASKKKRFQRNIKRFEIFLIDLVRLYLKLAKIHLTDDYVIQAVGRTEQVNIAEFRELPDVCYEINIEAQSEDVETKLGKQIVINHALQYVANRLKPEDIGKLMRQMPYCNFDQSFDDLTINYDNSVNDILALDRGEKPPVNQYDDHAYVISRLIARMKKADFRFLSPEVQMNYQQKLSLHENFQAQMQVAMQRAQQGLIPTGGYLVVCDLYVPQPDNPNKSQRVRLPAEAVQWLIKQMEGQASSLAPILSLPQGAQADIATRATAMQGGGQRGFDQNAGAQALINREALVSGGMKS